jgi:F420-dependent oxidoreductase-like protein
MSRPLHFGVTLPQIKRSWQEAREAASAFEAMGFDSLWVCDHLYGVPLPNFPIFEAWSELAAVAAITNRVELGTLVTPPYFRNPAVLAKQIATVDHVSNGRTICGLGAGWMSAEFESYGLPFPDVKERLRALEETIEVLLRLWSEPSTTYEGAYASLHDAYCEPKPIRRPPILVGGGGEKVLLGIAARHADIWNNLAVFQGQLARKIERLERHCDAAGRDFRDLVVSQQALVVITESEPEAREALGKALRIYGGHMGAGLEEHGIWGHPERVIDCIERHRELGCTMFILEFFGRDTREPARLFAERVMSRLRG